MVKILNNPYLSLIVRLILGSVYIFAAIGKIADPVTFAKEISRYGIMPDDLLNIFAMTLPWVELVIGIMLVAGVRLKASAAVTGILTLVFIIAILSAMARGLNINCGCFSKHVIIVGWQKVLEDVGLLLAAVYIFFFPVNRFTIERLAVDEAMRLNQQE